MNLPQRRLRHAIDSANLQLHDSLDDASETTGTLVARGRRLSRRGGRKLRYRAGQAQDLATDIGEKTARQARRAKRQVERHPLASIGIAAVIVAGAALLTARAIRRRREREVLAPDHDYFNNDDND